MTQRGPEEQYSQAKQAKRMAFVSIQAGCLTFVVAGIALVVGLWLDTRLGTPPRWMLISLLGSLPLTLGGVYLIVRRAIKRIRSEPGVDEENSPEK